MNCVIVDDEPLAREGMSDYVRQVNYLNLVAVCENCLELVDVMNKQTVDLIFLDVQMPRMNGMDFLKITKDPPIVIITSAYPTYALESFQLNVLDYLLKPILLDRFMQATQKAREYFQLLHPAQDDRAKKDYFFVKCENRYEKIIINDILFIEGMQNYVKIQTEKTKYLTLLNLKDMEANLDAEKFLRVHKSFIVNLSKIDSVEPHEISIQEARIPVSRNFRNQVLEKIVQSSLWKR